MFTPTRARGGVCGRQPPPPLSPCRSPPPPPASCVGVSVLVPPRPSSPPPSASTTRQPGPSSVLSLLLSPPRAAGTAAGDRRCKPAASSASSTWGAAATSRRSTSTCARMDRMRSCAVASCSIAITAQRYLRRAYTQQGGDGGWHGSSAIIMYGQNDRGSAHEGDVRRGAEMLGTEQRRPVAPPLGRQPRAPQRSRQRCASRGGCSC
jgi:hypothetical protein|eukprot:COSAG01_NODE_6212_length_3791_cov_470.642470_2_plen_207_part_00